MKGKFIVIYGINNIGKTTQAKLLVKNLKKKGIKAEYIKYPVYNLKPAGPLINSYLRRNNPHKFTPREVQLLHYIDRLKFETILKNKLEKGINIIAEEYFGTALAWGVATGVDGKLLEYFYSFLPKEDLAILLDGKRFERSIERNHNNEMDKEAASKAIKAFRVFGKKYGWKKIKANSKIDKIQKEIERIIKKVIK
jgi:thymidylate kinase